ncbi:MAG: phosphoenolpyruvate carboxykinase (ATP) [Bacteroidota bacterium]
MNLPQFRNAKIRQQLSPDELIADTLQHGQGSLSSTGALCIATGDFTGRSPQDKFVVDEAGVTEYVDWEGGFNHKIDSAKFERLKTDVLDYLDTKTELWWRRCVACAHPGYQLGVQVINEYPSSNLFAYNMFLTPEEAAGDNNMGEWTVIQAPGFSADPALHGTRSANFSVISFSRQLVLICGTGYTGEIKKGVFTVLNYLLPKEHSVLSMHCSANVGATGDVALFFGLSGTGKTTLSTDPERALIGDDEHGWDNSSVFNFEGGCYAKTIGLDEQQEPEIFAAIKHGALVENVVFLPGTNQIDFHNSTLTENTRVSYPLNFIKNIARPSRAGIPKTIFFLTCDATGVLPPVSKLNASQAKYYFLSGYTSKIAGTEAGITEPKPTFSTCFGAPFLPLHPSVYADLLGQKLAKENITVWLVNTGWSGLPYGQGKRISIKHTRAIITAALNGSLSQQQFEKFPVFDLQIPKTCPGVPSEILNPIDQFKAITPYLERLIDLAKKFKHNFIPYENMVSQDVAECCPE